MMKLSFLASISITLVGISMIISSQEESKTQKIDAFESRILSSTVRVQFDYWLVKSDESGYMIETSVGHGTVKDGRYLITHNHFSEPFSENREVEVQDIYTLVRIFNSAGTELATLPGDDVSIVVQDEATLVLDFGERDGLGTFETLGFASADFINWHSLPLEMGMEIAQVDWDGTTSRVDWTTVQKVKDGEPVARLVISDGLTAGSSGGGIFWQGRHLGNNWTSVYKIDAKGALVGQFSTAALNSSWVSVEELSSESSPFYSQSVIQSTQG